MRRDEFPLIDEAIRKAKLELCEELLRDLDEIDPAYDCQKNCNAYLGALNMHGKAKCVIQIKIKKLKGEQNENPD